MNLETDIEASWRRVLAGEFSLPYFKKLDAFVQQEYAAKTIFPIREDLFAAFRETPFAAVRVVILGQDPYHGIGQATGLTFSVRKGVPPPPSLRNILKEIASYISIGQTSVPRSDLCNLTRWAHQGVLLLNSVLTVEAGKPTSHAGVGWERFTDTCISAINREGNGVVFLLWGKYARSKKGLIDTTKHLVLEAPHPSPLSAHMGFFGCDHFTKTNAYLRDRGEREIMW